MDTITIDIEPRCERCGTHLECAANILQGGIISVRVEPCPVCRKQLLFSPSNSILAELLALAEGIQAGQVTQNETVNRIVALVAQFPTFAI